jgi:O-methyltransferase involved in polyketide biosynthesis
MNREKITLGGTQETMLATLYGRALDSRRPDPILGDVEAARAVRRIDYDFRKMGVTATTAAGVALRARQLDVWTAEFLAAHPSCTVLHLACGLDTRVHRLNPPGRVRWLDVDYPEILALRERLLPRPGGDYQTVGTSVTTPGWLERVPADRPVVAVFEGLSMYLREEEVRQLIRRVTGHFPSGQLLFDCYGTLGIRLQRLVPAVRRSGASLYWGLDDPRVVEGWHPGLRCVDALRSVDMPGVERMPRAGRLQMRILARLPGLRDIGRILRYRF